MGALAANFEAMEACLGGSSNSTDDETESVLYLFSQWIMDLFVGKPQSFFY